MVLSIDNDGKRKRIPQYTMAAQSVSPEYSAIIRAIYHHVFGKPILTL